MTDERGTAAGWNINRLDHATIWDWRAYAGPRVAFGQALTEDEAKQRAQEAMAQLQDVNTRDAATQAWMMEGS